MVNFISVYAQKIYNCGECNNTMYITISKVDDKKIVAHAQCTLDTCKNFGKRGIIPTTELEVDESTH